MAEADTVTPTAAPGPVPSAGHATDPAHLVELVFQAYNAGDLDAVERLFEPEALLVVEPGRTVRGVDRRAAIGALLARSPRFTGSARHIYPHGDLALIVSDFVLEETGPDGRTIRSEGTATDVARRGADGFWRYAIDNPAGTAG